MLEPSSQPPTRGLAQLLVDHPNHVPTIVHGKCLKDDGKKLMIPQNTTVAGFLSLLRSKKMLVNSNAGRSCFVLVNALLPTNAKTFGELFREGGGSNVVNVDICEENAYGGTVKNIFLLELYQAE